MKRRVETSTVEEVLGLEERSRGLTVTASTTRGTQGSGELAVDSAAAQVLFPFTESNTVSSGGGVPVPESY